MELLPLVLSSGWASGVNAYLVVLLLGLTGRLVETDQIPDVLTRTDVLVVAGVLFSVELVTDKIPYVDSTWDAVSTAIRPTVGAVIGVLLAGDVSTLEQAVYAVVGGGTALASHAVKAGLRLAINSSPEPVTNSVASVAEDLTVTTVVLLALAYPWVAAAIALLLLLAGSVLVLTLLRLVRRGRRRRQERRERRRAALADPPGP